MAQDGFQVCGESSPAKSSASGCRRTAPVGLWISRLKICCTATEGRKGAGVGAGSGAAMSVEAAPPPAACEKASGMNGPLAAAGAPDALGKGRCTARRANQQGHVDRADVDTQFQRAAGKTDGGVDLGELFLDSAAPVEV